MFKVTSEILFNKDKENVMQTYGRFPLAVEKGKGVKLWDFEGNEYIDLTTGIGVTSIGHTNPVWIEAIEGQIKKLGHISNLYYTEPGTLLAEKITKLSGMKRVFFANAGGEANEGLIKLCRKYSSEKYGSGRSTIITLLNSFHGRTITTLAATGQDKFHKDFHPFTEGFKYVPADDIDALKNAVTEDVCAVLIECVQGEGGVMPLDREYIKAVEALCAQKDLLFAIDEVQTGFGRTGTMFAFQKMGVSPDVVSMAKGIAGGLPLGGFMVNEKCADVLKPGDHATTFGANPVCCAAALAVVGEIEKCLPEIEKKGEYFRDKLKGLNSPLIKDVRGEGLMIGAVIEGMAPAELVKKLIAAGVLALTAGSDVLRLMPALNITYEEVDEAISKMSAVLAG